MEFDPAGGVALHAGCPLARAGHLLTTPQLHHEREAAAILGIPYESVMQVALIPVAYTIGTDFRPSSRVALDKVVHWERW